MACKRDSNDYLSIEKVKLFALEIVRKILPASYDCHFYLAGGCFKSMITKKEPNNIDLWAASEDDRTRLLRQLGGACLMYDDGGDHPTVVLKKGLPKINVYFNCPSSLDICLSHFDLVMSCIGVEFDSGKLMDSHVHFEANDDAQKKIVRVVRRIEHHKDNLLTLMRILRYAEELSYVVIPEAIKSLWRNTYASATQEKRRELLFSARLSSEDVPFEYEINRICKEGRPSEICRSYTAQELEQMNREVLSSKNNHPKDQKPIAVYLAGLPGSGKSTVARQTLSQLGFDSATINNMVNLDMDELRKYHAQFMAYLDESIVSNNREKRLIYKELIPWFNETSNAEFDIYKKSDSLSQILLERKLDFILPVHCLSSLDFLKYTSEKFEYVPYLIEIRVPFFVAQKRARRRARVTGRYTSYEYMQASEIELTKILDKGKKLVEKYKGASVTYENVLGGGSRMQQCNAFKNVTTHCDL